MEHSVGHLGAWGKTSCNKQTEGLKAWELAGCLIGSVILFEVQVDIIDMLVLCASLKHSVAQNISGHVAKSTFRNLGIKISRFKAFCPGASRVDEEADGFAHEGVRQLGAWIETSSSIE